MLKRQVCVPIWSNDQDSRGCSKESISDCFDLHENKIQHYYWNVTLCRLACLVSSVGVGEDGGLLVAEGLDAGLGLDGVPAHAGDVGGDGRDVDLALGVSAHWQENIVVTSERIHNSQLVMMHIFLLAGKLAIVQLVGKAPSCRLGFHGS